MVIFDLREMGLGNRRLKGKGVIPLGARLWAAWARAWFLSAPFGLCCQTYTLGLGPVQRSPGPAAHGQWSEVLSYRLTC